MAIVTYIEFGSKSHAVDVKNGRSVMDGAVKNGVPGIVAECGGSCACATCHVYVDPCWIHLTGEATGLEQATLEGAASEVRSNSRLSCQIRVTDALNGLIVRIPETQH